tara:strand:+ start:164 stop:478 length:315 start_codon:yes stop_codon:yes gene_type:complete
MGMINMSGSMKYGPSGKRRKTNAWKQKKRHQIKLEELRMTPTSQKKPEKVIPSLTSNVGSGQGTKNLAWEQEKQKISSQYTIAPAYNKGAYQVIGKSNIKDIGK